MSSIYRRFIVGFCFAGLALMLMLSAGSARGATLTWDSNAGSAGVTDGAGTWGAANQWWTGAANQAWADGSDAVIGNNNGAAGTLTVGSAATVKSITFNQPGSGSYTVSGSTLNLGSAATPITNNVSAIISSILAGSSMGLTKAGSATLTLSGANTYSGTTTLSEGSIQLSLTAGLREGRLGSVFDTTSANPSTNVTTSTRLANTNAKPPWGDNETWVYTGFLNITNASPVKWSFVENVDDYSLLKIDGVTILNDSTWNSPAMANYALTPGLHYFEARFGNGGGGAGFSNQGWLNNSIGFGYDSQGRAQSTAGNFVAMTDSGSGQLFQTGQGLSLSSPLAVASGSVLDLNGGSGTMASLADSGGAGGTITNTATTPSAILFAGTGISGTTTFSGTIADGGFSRGISVIKAGTYTQVLSGSTPYSGATVIQAGVLQFGTGSTGGTPPSSSDIVNNGALVINRSVNTTYSGIMSGSGTITNAGTGTLRLANTQIYTGATTITNGTLQLQAPSTSLSGVPGLAIRLDASDVTGSGNPAAGTAMTTWTNLAGVGSFTGSGAIFHPTAFAMNGLPVVHFNGSGVLSSYTNLGTGITMAYVGRLTGGANARLVGSSNVNWIFGYHGGTQGDAYYNGWVYDSGQGVNYGGNLYEGIIPGSGFNSLIYQNGVLLGSNQGGVTGPSTMTLGGMYTDGSEKSYGDIGELLVFTNVLTEVQRLQVERYLQAKWQGVMPMATAVSLAGSGAILDLNGVNQQIGSLAGVAGSKVTLNGGWLSVGTANTTTTFSGIIDAGSDLTRGVTKNGTGDLVLDGSTSCTYTGATVLASGRLGLAKTGGARAVNGNFVGINNASPEIFTLADDQFAPGCVMYFQGNEGDHVRFELLGTTQTLAGIDNSASSGRGLIQHNEQSGRTQVSGLSTLILNGDGTYFYNAYLRDNGGKVRLTKSGAGTQTLAGTVIDYSGATDLQQGRLIFQDLDDWWTTNIAIGGSATFEIKTASRNTGINGAMTISGSGTVVKSGTYTFTTGGASGYTRWNQTGGWIDVQQGTINNDYCDQAVAWVNNKASMNVAAGAVVNMVGGNIITVDALTGSGTIQNNNNWGVGVFTVGVNSGSGTFAGLLTDAGGQVALVKAGTGTQTLTGTNTYSGGTTVNGGTLRVMNTSGSGTGSGAVTVNGGATLAGSGTVAGTLTVNPDGALVPGASVGTLTVGSLTMAQGSSYDFEFNSTPTNDLIVVTNSAGLTINGGGINLYQEGTNTAWTTPGTYNLISYGGSIGGSGIGELAVLNPAPGRSYAFSTNGAWITVTIEASPVWSGAGGDNSWQTGANWDGGTPAPSNTLTFGKSGAARLTNSNDFDANTRFGGITFANGSSYTLSGNAVNLLGNVINSTALDQTINLDLTLDGGNRTFGAGSGSLTIDGVISDDGSSRSLYKTGAGTLTLGGANAYTGNTMLQEGTTRVAGSSVFNVTPIYLMPGAVLDLNGYNNAIAALLDGAVGAGGTVVCNGANATLGVGGNNATTTFSGLLQDGTASLSLTKNGSGALYLAGNNTYSGSTLITAGTLQVGNSTSAGALGTGPVSNSSVLAFRRTNSHSVSNAISGGTIQQLGGTLTLAGTGAVTSAIDIYYGSALVLNKSVANPISGTITVINNQGGGSITLGASDQIADTAVVVLYGYHYNGVGVFSLNGFNETLAGIDGAVYWNSGGPVVQNNGATDSTLTISVPSGTTRGITSGNSYNKNLSVRNGSTGKLNIVKDGAGTQYFGNAGDTELGTIISYTGTTTINAGTYSIRAADYNSSTSAINGGTLEFYAPGWAATKAVNAAIGGTALGTVAINGGTGKISFGGGNKTYSGPTAIGSSATLLLGAANSFSQNSRHVLTSATIDINSLSANIGSLHGSGSVLLTGTAASVLGVGYDNTLDGSFSGALSGAGSILKAGTGMQTLSGANTYTGTTAVNGGTLLLSGTHVGGGAYTVAGATLRGSGALNAAVTVQNAGVLSGTLSITNLVTAQAGSVIDPGTAGVGTLTAANVTLEAGSSLRYSSASNGVLQVTSVFTTPATPVVINITAVAGLGTYPLIRYGSYGGSGYAGLVLGTLPRGVSATLANNTGNKSVDLVVTAVGAATVTWTGATSGNWDINATTNWLYAGAPSVYLDGDLASFGDAPGSNYVVTLTTNVAPGRITFTNAAYATTLAGPRTIYGSAPLWKYGAGTVSLLAPNSYGGGTFLAGGLLVFTNNALGGGNITFTNHSSLQWYSNNVQDISAQLRCGPSVTGTLDIAANNVSFGSSLLAANWQGVLVKGGAGTLTLSGATYTAGTILNGGEVQLMAANVGYGPWTINSGATLRGMATDSINTMSSITINNGGRIVQSGPNGGYQQFYNNNGGGTVLILNGGRIESTSTPHGNYGCYLLRGNVLVGGTNTSTIAADFRMGDNATRTFTVNQTGDPSGVDLDVTANFSHFNNVTWGYMLKTGPGTMRFSPTAVNQVGSLTLSEGKVLFVDHLTGWGNGGIANNSIFEDSLGTGITAAYSSTLTGYGTFIKSGAGTLQFSGGGQTIAQGQFNIQGGVLQNLNNAVNWSGNASGMDISSGATVDLYGDAIYVDRLSGAGTIRNTYGNSAGYSGTVPYTERLTVGPGSGRSTFSGSIADTGLAGAGGNQGLLDLVKTGAGTLVLQGANTYAGITTVNGGTLVLDAATGSLNSLSGLTLGGGSFTLKGKSSGTTAQTLGALTLASNTASTITLDPNNGTSTILTLGDSWTRNPGSSLLIDYSSPNTGTRQVVTANPTTGYTLNSSGYYPAIMVKDSAGVIGFATRAAGLNQPITRFNDSNGNTLTNDSNDAGIDFTSLNSVYAGGILNWNSGVTHRAVSSLIFDTTNNGGTVDMWDPTNILTLTTGTILFRGANNLTLQGGQCGANDAELIVQQAGPGVFTIASSVSGGGGILTKGGPGTLALSGTNTFSGGTFINGGTVSVPTLLDSGSSALGNGGTLTLNGGALRFTASLGYTTRTLSLLAPSVIDVAGSGELRFTGSGTGGGGVTKLGTGTLQLDAGVASDRIRLGSTGNDLGSLVVSNGTVTVTKTYIIMGQGGGGIAALTIAGGTLLHTGSGGLYMSDTTGAPSVLTVTSGLYADANQLTMGNSSAGSSTVNVSGGTLAFGSTGYLGNNSPAIWTQTGGTTVFSNEVWLARGAATSAMTLSGGTFSCPTYNWLNVGYGTGQATLNVTTGATLSVKRLLLARDNASSKGTLNMDGGSITVVSDQPLYISHAGTGEWNQSGGDVVMSGHEVRITQDGLSGMGTMNLSGGTFKHTSDNWFTVGYGSGQATLNLSSNAYLEVVDFIQARDRSVSRGTVNMSGGTLKVGSQNISYLAHVGLGVWNQTGGTAIFQNQVIVANSAGSIGRVNISGGSLTTAANNWLQLGVAGTSADMVLSGTGTVTCGCFLMANGACNSTFNMNGGSFTANNASQNFFGYTGAGASTFTQTGGTATFNNEIRVCAGTGPANLTINNGVFNHSTGIFYLGYSTGNAKATMTINGGAVTNNGGFYVGNQTGSHGALYQNGGTLVVRSGEFDMGFLQANNTPYGFYRMTGGALTTPSYFQVARSGTGLMYQHGGTIAAQGGSGLWIGNTLATGVVYHTGGTYGSAQATYLGNNATSRGELTIAGTASVTVTNDIVMNNAAAFSVLNLNGGTLQANRIYKSNAGGTTIVNFNGGTWKANASSGIIMGSGVGNAHDAAYIHSGGATIDDNGRSVTISQSLLVPPGNGVAGIQVANGGAAYIGAPYVQISGGGGSGATAVAIIDVVTNSPTFGKVTDIVMTSRGVNYSSTPTVSLLWGAGSGAASGAVTLAANTGGALTKNGAGTVTLSGANTYNGGTLNNAGTLTMGHASALGTGTLTFNGGWLDCSSANLSNLNNNAQSWSSNFTFVGSQNLDLGTGAVAIPAARNVTIAAGTLTVRGNMTGSGSVNKLGPGTLALWGTSSHIGGTTLSAGTLNLNSGTAPGTGTLTLGGGYLGNTSGGAVTLANNNLQTWSGDFTFTGTNDLNLGTGAVTLTENRAISVNANVLTVGGAISGSGYGLNKSGNGTLTLNGANTYSGNTTISGGRVVLGAAASLASSPVISVGSGAVLDVSAISAFSLGSNRTLAGSGTVTGSVSTASGAVLQPGTAGAAGTLTFTNSSLTLAAGTTNVFDLVTSTGIGGGTNDLIWVNGNITNTGGGSTIAINPLQPLTSGTYKLFYYSGSTNGAFSTNIICTLPSSPYTFTLDTSETNWIKVTVVGASANLTWAGDGAGNLWDIATSANWVGPTNFHSGDTVLFNDTSANTSVNLNGTLLPTAVTNTSATRNYTLAGAGKISGNTGLFKTGAATMTISTTNDFTGPTLISAGTLILSNATAYGSLIISNNSALAVTMDSSYALLYTNPIVGSGSLTKNGAGTLTVGGVNTYSGATTIGAGTLKLQAPVTTAPNTIAGLSYWLDAASISGLTNVAPVSLWPDLSGNGNHFAQSTAANQPWYVAGGLGGINGRPVIRFNGSTHQLVYGSTLTPTNVYIFTRSFGYGTLNGVWGNSSPGDKGIRQSSATAWSSPGDANDFCNGTGGAYYINGVAGNTFVSGAPHLLEAYRGASHTSAYNNTIIGGYYSGRYYSGDVAEVLVFNTPLSTADRQKVETYMLGKWGGVLPMATAVNLSSSASLFDLNGVNQTVGSLSGVSLSQVTLNGAVLSVGQDNTSTTFSGVIADGSVAGGSFVKIGTGILTLSGTSANTYTGATTLGGAGQIFLAKSHNTAAIPGDIYMQSYAIRSTVATVSNNQFGAGTVMRFPANAGDTRFELKGTTQTLAGIEALGDPITYSCIQHNENTGAAVGSLSTLVLNVPAGTNYAFASSGKVVIRDYTGGTLRLIKTGAGTQTLTGSGISYTAGTTVSNGVLVLGGDNGGNGVIRGAVTVESSATVLSLTGNTHGYSAGSSVSSLLIRGGTYGGTDFYNHFWNNFPLTMVGGTLILGASNNEFHNPTITVSNSTAMSRILGVTPNAYIRLRDGTSGTFVVEDGPQPIDLLVDVYIGYNSGTSGITKNGAGTMLMTQVNSYNGGTTINAGTIMLSNPLGLQVSTVNNLVNGGLAFSNATAFTLGGLQGTGNITLENTAGAGVVLSAGNNGASTTYAGALSGSGSFCKIGAGTLIVTNVHSYTGGTLLNAGILSVRPQANGVGSLGSGTITFNVGGAGLSADSAAVVITNDVLIAQVDHRFGGAAGTYPITITGTVTLSPPSTWVDPHIFNVTTIAGNYVGGTKILYKYETGDLRFAGTNTVGRILNYANGGTVSFIGNSVTTFSGNFDSKAGGTLVVSNNAIVDANQVFLGTDGNGNWGTLNIYGGLLNLRSTDGTRVLTIGEYSGATSYVNVYGGQLIVATGTGRTYIGWSGGGILSISGGLAKLRTIRAGGAGGAINLTGGELSMGTGGLDWTGGPQPAINLGGGRLSAFESWSTAVPMTLTGTNGNVVVDTTNLTITVTGVLSGTGGLNKVGSGLLMLQGNNTFTGAAAITNGTVLVNGNHTGTGPWTVAGGSLGGTGAVAGTVTVANGAVLSQSLCTNGTLTVSSLVASNGATFRLWIGGGTTGLVVTANNGFTRFAGATNRIELLSYGVSTTGTYPLIDYTGSIQGSGTGFVLAPSRLQGYVTNDTVNTRVDVVITNILPYSTIWKGDVNDLWDVGATTNWRDLVSSPTTFTQSDGVLFDESAVTYTVTVSQAVLPDSVLVINTNRTYQWNGSYGLTGAGSITKEGSGTLVLNQNNANTGATVINGGTLQVGAGGAAGWPGTGVVTNNGTLVYNRSDTITAHVIAGPGSLTKSGGGMLLITNDQTYAGGTLVASGSLRMGNNTPAGSVLGVITNNGNLDIYRNDAYTFTNNVIGSGNIYCYSPGGNGATLTGNISIGGLLEFLNNGQNILSNATVAAGYLYLDDNGQNGYVTQNGGSVTVTNAAGNLFRIAHWNATGTYTINGGALTNLNGRISIGWNGVGTLNIYGGQVDTPQLTIDEDNTGGTSTLTMTNGTLRIGAGGITAGNASAINLGGGVLTASANWSSSRPMTLTTTPGTFTIDPSNSIITLSGTLSGNGALFVAGSGSGSVVLSGANTYTGTTSVAGVSLQVNNAHTGAGAYGVTSGSLIVGASGVIFTPSMTASGTGRITGSGRISAPVTVNGGAKLEGGTAGAGTLTASNGVTFATGAIWQVGLTDFAQAAGTGWGILAVSNTLNFGSVPMTLRLTSYSSGLPGPAENFSPYGAYTCLVAQASAIAGFDTNNITIDATTAFANGSQGTWSLRTNASVQIELVYAPRQSSEDPVTAWTRSVPITFSGYTGSETLTNFPALIVLNCGFANGTNVYSLLSDSTNGYDLRFTTNTSTGSFLSYEVEKWDTNGNSYVWVRVPQLSAGSAIYLMAGNTNAVFSLPSYATDGSTWTNGYAAVYHFAGGGASDSASTNNGTKVGAGSVATGRVGDALNFDGSSQYVTLPAGFANFNNGITIEAWARFANNGNYARIMDFGWTSGGGANVLMYRQGTSQAAGMEFLSTGGGTEAIEIANTIPPTGTWGMWAGSCSAGAANASLARVYMNGVVRGEQTTFSLPANTSRPQNYVGRSNWASDSLFSGIMDELRISTVERSTNWMWATYLNVSAPAAFYTVAGVTDKSTYRDEDTALAGRQEGNGSWNLSNTRWLDSSQTANLAWVHGSKAVFGGGTDNGGTSTVTLDNDIYVSGITFTNGGLTLVTGTTNSVYLPYPDTPLNTVRNGEISAPLAGTGFNKTGAGTLTLGAVNTHDGDSTLSAGTLRLTNPGALTSSTFNGTAGGLSFAALTNATFGGLKGTMIFGLTNDTGAAVALTVGGNTQSTTYSGSLGGSGSLAKVGAGALTFAGATGNTYTGRTTLTVGQLGLSKTSGYAVPGDFYGDNNASPDVYTTADNQFAPGSVMYFINNSGDHVRFELLGTTQTLAGIDNTAASSRGVIQQREQVTNASVSATSTLILTGSGNYAFSAYFRDSGGRLQLTKGGTGTQTLAGVNVDYSGATTVNGGRLILQDLDGVYPSAFAIGSGATLEVSTLANNAVISSNTTVSGSGTFVKSGSATFTTGMSGIYARWTMTNGLVDIRGGSFVNNFTTPSVAWGNNRASMNVQAGATVSMVGANHISVNSLTGGGTVNNISNSGTAVFTVGNNNGSGTFSGVLRDQGGVLALTKSGTGTLTLTGTNAYTGITTVSAGSLEVAGAGLLGGGTYSGGIVNSGTLKMGSSASQTLGGVISGGGTLLKDGAGTLTLTGANTYSGDTTVSAGRLVVGATSTLGSSMTVTVAANASLTLQNTGSGINDVAIVALNTGTGRVQLDAGVNEQIQSLFMDGHPALKGTWGSTASSASYKTDQWFTGTGIITVLRGPVSSVILFR